MTEKDPKRSSRFNNQTLDTFFILKDNMGKVIESINTDGELQFVVLDPPELGASHYTAKLQVGDDLVNIVDIMLSGAKYLGCFDPRFKSEEYEQMYGPEIMNVYNRLKKIFSDNSEEKVRDYLRRATPVPGSQPIP